MQTAEKKPITYKLELNANIEDTGLLGYFPAIHKQILVKFGSGRPDYDTWKSTCEWSFSDDQGGVYTLYDYGSPKRTYKRLQLWHIGGNEVARENFESFREWLRTHLDYAWNGHITPVARLGHTQEKRQ